MQFISQEVCLVCPKTKTAPQNWMIWCYLDLSAFFWPLHKANFWFTSQLLITESLILVGGLEHEFYFSIYIYIYICILAIIISTDELIFFRGVGQPPTSHRCCLNSWEIQTLVGVSGVTSQICWSQICWESGASSNWYTAAWWLAEPWATRGTRWRLNSAAKLVYTSN